MADIGRSIRFCILVAALTPVFPTASGAQTAKEGKQGKPTAIEIEEITVTAQKREENIQETPISITALTGATLAQKGVSDVINLGEAVPNVRITMSPGSSSATTITMRGLAQGDPSETVQPAVGMYIDGVYVSRVLGSNFDLDDLERVEVLRGPQGTLYGRNTIGGAINFITRKPDEQRSASVSTEVGNYDTFKGQATLNVPLIGKNGFLQSDAVGTLSLRETAGYKTHDGFYTNTGNGSANFDNLNRVFTRTALRWQPTKEIAVDYSFAYHRYRDAPTAFQDTYVYPGGPVDGGAYDLNPFVHRNRVDAIANDRTYMEDFSLHRLKDDGNNRMHTLTAAWDLGEVGRLGNVTVKSISSYRSFFVQQDQSLAGSPMHLLDTSTRQDIQHWSEELQWVGSGPRLQYVVGAYYYGEYVSHKDLSFLGGDFIANFPHTNHTKIKSYAGFGQATWTPPILRDKLSVTVGLRFTQEQFHIDRFFKCALVGIPDGQGGYIDFCNQGIFGLNDFTASAGKAFGGLHGSGTPGVSPMGDIAYQWTDELMTYFRVARGFKGGGFNGTAQDPISFSTAFQPEIVLQYEAGFKSQWFDNRLRVNADGFYSDYTNQQVSVFRASPTTGTANVQTNAASSEIWGSEVEVAAAPLRGVDLTATYAYVAPKFKEFLDQKFDADGLPVFDANGNPVLEDVKDQRSFAFTPKNQFTLGFSYTAPPTSHGTLSLHADTYWQDQVTFITNDNTDGARAMKGWNYAVVNGRLQFVGIPLQKGSLDLAVFGRNLFDRKYRTFGVDFGPSVGWSGNNYGNPRTFGLQLTYNFTAGESAPAPPAPVTQAAPPPPPPAKKKIVLRSVHFDFDKATLKADAKPILDEAVQVLKQEGSVDIVVEGHTDSVGTEQYNLGLSRRRADTVRRYLVEHGVAASRITAEGMGESKPVASNDTADGRAQNRRVELHVK